MRNAILVLALLGLTVVLVWVSRSISGLHYTIDGEPGDLLYAAAFSAGSDGWSAYDDGRLAAQAADGRLLLRVNQAGSAAFSTAPFHFTDVVLNATSRAVEGPVDNGFGLIVGLQTQDNTRPDDDTYLLFLISSDGYYSARQRTGGAERELSTWIPSPAVRPGLGQDNQLEVTLSGSVARFAVNGEALAFCLPDEPGGTSTYYLDTCVDGTMADALPVTGAEVGRVGVVALATMTGGTGVTVQFDDVVVTAP